MPKTNNKAAVKKHGSKNKAVKPFIWFAAICFVIYSLVTIVYQRVAIYQLRQEQTEIESRISRAKEQNDEYVRLLSSDDDSEYIERIAIEKLGYAYPNERRFYVVENH